jgi:hypothetical protein
MLSVGVYLKAGPRLVNVDGYGPNDATEVPDMPDPTNWMFGLEA